MRDVRRSEMIRKAIIVVLTLAAVGMCCLWVDSYRTRDLKPTGLAYQFGHWDPLIVSTRTGMFSLRYDTDIGTDTTIPEKDVGAFGFRYKQWLRHSSSHRFPGDPTIKYYHRVREISLSFAALVVALACYPTIAFIRGPLRRHRRQLCLMIRVRTILAITCACLLLLFGFTWVFFDGRAFIWPVLASLLSGLYIAIWVFNRQAPDDPGGRLWREEQQRRRRLGLCFACGYDLTGNESGVCPECGTQTEQPPINRTNE